MPSNPGPEPQQLTVRYPIEEPNLPLQQPANYVHFAQLGGDFQMSLGVLDPAIAAAARVAGEPIEPHILGRYFLSVNSIQLLHRQVADIMKRAKVEPMDETLIKDVEE